MVLRFQIAVMKGTVKETVTLFQHSASQPDEITGTATP